MRLTELEGCSRASQLALLVSILLLASASSAEQTYSILEGVWGNSAGQAADIPFIGQTVDNCNQLPLAYGGHSLSPASTPSITTTVIAQQFGCPSWDPSVAMTLMTDEMVTSGGLGGAFTIPPFFFRRDAPGMIVGISIPNNPAIVQAATSARWRVPFNARASGLDAIGIPKNPAAGGNPALLGPLRRMPSDCTLGGPGGPGGTVGNTANPPDCTNLAPFARFHRSAYKGGPSSSYNGQTGRAGKSFTFCPKPGNVNPPASGPLTCTSLADGDPDDILVKYTGGGPRGFGGTLNQVVDSGSPDGSLAVGIGGGKAAFLKLDSQTQSIQGQARGYADFVTDLVSGASIVATSYMTGNVQVQGPGGGVIKTVMLITTIGNTEAIADQPAPFPTLFGNDAYNRVYNFPLTTGTVIARAMNAGATPFITFTAMGKDELTASGARNIQLVAASIAHLTTPPTNTAGIQQMFLPEPGRAGQLLAGAVILLGLAVWRARVGCGA